ncbi:GAF and HD-GYP domain-containing protein [Thalassolituus hydrocarboniclasticus]|uniref:GAF domain-containing protein n=1 Tax=Thalassolituus hydrocarboniclasticus TaxID=2742796 RepID=A0ABY6A7D7_9GAMM|nr:HD family phosphohydrolase [Thalassolituus hydrocarboniclasticus]UXD86882.1 GAF domain-containing protein [Thalassolituus hydrocarboniclasticus]
MNTTPTLFFPDSLPQEARAAVQALLDAGCVLAAAAASADIGLYPKTQQALCLQAPQGQIRLLEYDQHSGIDYHTLGADILLPVNFPLPFLRNALQQALRIVQQQQQSQLLTRQLEHQENQFERLMDIGLALSAEQDHARLLVRILQEARRFANCDAASIFLIEPGEHGERQLVFKLSQNDSVEFHSEEQHFTLNRSSLAGYAALSGDILNFDDVYHLPAGSPFTFNKAYDQKLGYRTRSMLVIPMRTHDGKIVGVIQFINRKRSPKIRLNNAEIAERETLPFDERLVTLLETMASQAGIAIENNLLIERINTLFEGFVSASVHAIEQRDPTTSGHSFRVAELTIALAEAAHSETGREYQAIRFRSEELRELRYAALLHDFGKVGVREHVLVKAKKLSPEAWVRFHYRIALQKERVRNHFLQQKLVAARERRLNTEYEQQLQQAEEQALQKLDAMQQAVELANEPSILDEGTFGHLQLLRGEVYADIDGCERPLLEDQDFLALAVRRGSLTEEERREIESHVSHTIRFLATIPWTPELERIPQIAGAHHEKLDGTGYPHGLSSADIPVGAKMMAVCDIFDALTASDRPYKAAMPVERALDILHADAGNQKIDASLVRLFSRLPLLQILPGLKSI